MDALTESVLKRFAQLLPPENPEPDWTAPAFRWVRRTYMGTVVGRLEAVPHFAHVDVETLIHINEQKAQEIEYERRLAQSNSCGGSLPTTFF